MLAMPDAVFSKTISVFLNISGVILGFLGFFLPWGTWSWRPGVYAMSNLMVGIGIPLGLIALLGWLIATCSSMFMQVKGQSRSRGFAVVGGILTTIGALVWTAAPGTLMCSSKIYSPSYGAYISLVGGILIVAGAALCQV
jgi:hypothetical protein